MMVLDAAAAAVLAAMLAVALYNLATAPRLEDAGSPRGTPPVSILVPARDEAENLARTLPLLLAQDWPRLEVVVLDDQSRDATARVAGALALAHPDRLRVLPGSAPPPGWLGKNWACRQLASAARGDVLVFCDADVSAAPQAVRRTLALLESSAAGAVTAIPRQCFGGWMEAAVVPLIVNLPVAALLPMRLVSSVSSPRLSMGNGQWMAFPRCAYERIGGHGAVRANVVEDVALARRVKACGLRLVACAAPSLLSVRMYRGAAAMREGFRKNLRPLLGGRTLPFAAGLALLVLAWLYPLSALVRPTPLAVLSLSLLAGVRAAGAALFRHGWPSVLLHPVGVVAAAALAVDSWVAHARGRVGWKGRRLPADPSASSAALRAGGG